MRGARHTDGQATIAGATLIAEGVLAALPCQRCLMSASYRYSAGGGIGYFVLADRPMLTFADFFWLVGRGTDDARFYY